MNFNSKDIKVLGIIPARRGSKRLIEKNIKELYGKSLISWTIEAAKNAKMLSEIIVTTEDDVIENIGQELGIRVIKRPLELAQDSSTTVDVIWHTLECLKIEGKRPEYLVLLQPTSPLRTAECIDAAIKMLLDNKDKYDSLISVTQVERPPWWMRIINEQGVLEEFIDKQLEENMQTKNIFCKNGAIYIISTEEFYKNKSLETKKTLGYVMDSFSSVDIDTEIDFILAEAILKKL